MGTNAQALLNKFATVATGLCGQEHLESNVNDRTVSVIFREREREKERKN